MLQSALYNWIWMATGGSITPVTIVVHDHLASDEARLFGDPSPADAAQGQDQDQDQEDHVLCRHVDIVFGSHADAATVMAHIGGRCGFLG
jgi:hypothetical protein